MEVKTINNIFSIFGNYSNFLGLKDKLVAEFSDFQYKELNDRLANGEVTKHYIFQNKNIIIHIRIMRIDIEYGYISSDCSTYKFMEVVNSIALRLEKLYDVIGYRIAFNCTEFVENTDDEITRKLNSLFNIQNIFEENSKEFMMRLNHVKHINNEDYNSIITIQDGNITENKTQKQMKVVFMNKDINTLPSNRENRFQITEVGNQLGDMIFESKEKTQLLLAKLMFL